MGSCFVLELSQKPFSEVLQKGVVPRAEEEKCSPRAGTQEHLRAELHYSLKLPGWSRITQRAEGWLDLSIVIHSFNLQQNRK